MTPELVIIIIMSIGMIFISIDIWRTWRRIQEIERRLDNTFHQGPERKPVSLNRQRTTQGEKGVARQSHVQVRGQRINNPEK